MRTIHFLSNLKFFSKGEDTKKECHTPTHQKEIQKDEVVNQDMELKAMSNLNFKLIDIDKAFAN